MKNVKYEYSSIQMNLPKNIAEEIIKWGKDNISDTEIFVMPKDPGLGRENEIHCTVLYGLHSDKPDEVKKLIKEQKPIEIKLGKVEVFTNPDKYDVVVINVISNDLRRLNKHIRDNVEYTNKYKSYRPHVTIAYVKKGKGWKHRGEDKWKNEKFTCDQLLFSSKNGEKNIISLK